jgi:type VI secretion system secreted protein VgrG
MIMMYKSIILTFVCLFLYTEIRWEKTILIENTNYYPDFLYAYEKIRRWEGNYAYLQDDSGGETYAGIARNANRNWEGWDILDEYKKDSLVEWNQKIEELEKSVILYYYNIWVEHGYYKIKEPFVRDYIFDYHNTGPISYRHVKQVLNEMGHDVGSKAVLDQKTIEALNKVNPSIFIERLQDVRRGYYEGVADRNPELKKYLKGWVNRANDVIT